jgi:hypothetical protein
VSTVSHALYLIILFFSITIAVYSTCSCLYCYIEIDATFDCASWDEKDVPKLEGQTLRITRTRTERTFKGGMKGKGVAEYTFIYHPTKGEVKAGTPSIFPIGGHVILTRDDLFMIETGAHGEGMYVTYNGLMYFKGTIDVPTEARSTANFEGA